MYFSTPAGVWTFVGCIVTKQHATASFCVVGCFEEKSHIDLLCIV